MILLDTHIWIWYVSGAERLPTALRTSLDEHVHESLGVSVISCWEVAKLVEYDRLDLDRPVQRWLDQALAHPGIRLINLTPQIAVASTQLPGTFHRDPADQMLVATAQVYDCDLATLDRRISDYPHVRTRS